MAQYFNALLATNSRMPDAIQDGPSIGRTGDACEVLQNPSTPMARKAAG